MAEKTTIKSAKKATAMPVEAIRHQDTWQNIPTEELRDFVTEEELAPRTMLYPRDPSLDPPYGIKFGSNWQVSTR